ncbi:octaprenyl diphosphate synthase [Candidatus Erwinia haradaeae]|uniref:Octaprenyl diphosphate synthase n=1 Tax=Candidatus Erwinia haradaeae TaxID=1922217 RepID=A0A451D1X1_9GAMM|nr:octaprenyl diphosphate synthase [Candidatus Erwinia haradaeae]VFP79608.1 Octaprenyl diphosphate synthase [Candidatus Erwinia haradaeae]
MNLKYIKKLIAHDMQAVKETIRHQLNSNIPLINQLIDYMIDSGGKHIRPIITILAARAIDHYSGKKHITMAALIEFIHTATLLHDDVVDQSEIRRGKYTANITFGNAASVLVGDFIYTRAFQMMTSLGSLKVLDLLSKAVNVISEGEMLQLLNCKNPNMTEEKYMNIIYSKTARLFEAATQCSAILAESTAAQEQSLRDYGRYIGTAFQLIDDLLDYSAYNNKRFGKIIGSDLNEGKLTLPLLHAINHSSLEEANFIRSVIEKGNGRNFLKQILKIMNQHNSLEYTQLAAKKEANKAIYALQVLPKSPWRNALEALANILIQRTM